MIYKNERPTALGIVILALILLIISSCAVKSGSEGAHSESGQPGYVVYKYLLNTQSSENNIKKNLQTFRGNKYVQRLVSKHKISIEKLYLNDILGPLAKNKYDDQVLASFEPSKADVTALLKLFPLDAPKLIAAIGAQQSISKEDIYEIVISAGLDPSTVFGAASSGLVNSVTPLIHSAGIVIYGQEEGSTSSVKFKKKSETTWSNGFSLSLEPIFNALSGSIVNLEAETLYELEVVVVDSNKTENLYSFEFTTRSESPPIDPNKIYYLSEIYDGGQLDLEALDISGNEDGYAKIIGDGIVIEAGNEFLSAVNIGSKSYVMLENFTIKGGQRYGIYAKSTHHIWIKGCDISSYGRIATDYRNNIGYENENSGSPINYDSGIYLEKTGVSVIEECEIHSPNGKANHWGYGHPNGPNALQVYAYHPDEDLRGQIIVRNNKFYGTNLNRFNDVIEGRKNTWRNGGFVRDSAIYGNYLAYANDDLIEIDGGQRNVLVYNNELTQGYAGISIAPNRLGPSYLFHNYIHNLGDERGQEWTAIKAGGLMSQPGGKTFILENYIITNRNGIAASRVEGDSTFWIDARNNIIINRLYNNLVGLGVYDLEKYPSSRYINNIIFNTQLLSPNLDVASGSLEEHPLTYDINYIETLLSGPTTPLAIQSNYWIENFSNYSSAPQAPVNSSTKDTITVYEDTLTPFDNQTKYGTVNVDGDNSVTLTGNSWYKMPVDFYIEEDTLLTFDLHTFGSAEIVGLVLETDNKLTQEKLLRFDGTQDYGNDLTHLFNSKVPSSITINIGKYHTGKLNYIVFVLDNDIDELMNNSEVTFENFILSNTANETVNTINNDMEIMVGIH